MDTATQDHRMRFAVTGFCYLSLAILSFWLLIIGKNFLIPLVIAIFAAFLIEVITTLWMKIPFGSRRMPRWLATILSGALIVLITIGIGDVIANNAARVTKDAPEYTENLNRVYETLSAKAEKLGFDDPDALKGLVRKIDFGAVVGSFAAGMASLLGDSALVLVYLFFMTIERKFFLPKLRAIIPDPERQEVVRTLIKKIDRDIRIYIGVKTFVSILTSLGSFIIMEWIGLRYAEFWALLIFVLNFIPNIGSLIATLLPTLLALVQFEQPGRPVLIVGVGVTAVQLFIANVVEPPLMGKSLNISPLIVILALVFWGMVWGIAGMFLCVPISVVGMIIFSHFDSTRWIAVLLSKDGRVRGIVTPSRKPDPGS